MKLYVKKPSGRYRAARPNEVREVASAYAAERLRGEAFVISCVEDVRKYLGDAMRFLEREKFCVLFLDNRHRLLAFEPMFNGTVDGTTVYPREVVKRALEHNAAAIILAHNHPSGVAEPSQADERITRRLKTALELVDIRLIDHAIVAGKNVVSMAARGLL